MIGPKHGSPPVATEVVEPQMLGRAFEASIIAVLDSIIIEHSVY